ncbi:MAG: tRNA (guanosine(37)-N1)-methyltransferase TrmD [Armatimonadota bacterium]|nr:tRNA (guanosine(37)-N1)-methyltransferase TrmD [Armatimonadota bacterium]
MRIDILTTFPQIIEAVCSESILGKARDKGILDIRAVNLRDYATDKHKSTDDEPYGGGPGMVMKCEPVFRAVEALTATSVPGKPRIILMTPQGKLLNQKLAEELANENHLIVICGRYEGVDERIREHLVTDEISIGDYILSGGELPALVLVESVARLVPGVLGDETSAKTESFSSGLLEYAQYTRPADFRGYKVPEVLLSGNHAEIARWRRRNSLERTLRRRPDLLETAPLTDEDREILAQLRSDAARGNKE